MAIVIDPEYGPKPSMTLLGGSPTTLAKGSVPFLPGGGRGIRTVGSGPLRTVSYAHVYRTQPWVGTAIRRMAEAIARLTVALYVYLDDAGDTRDRDRRHGAARLLRRPRPRQVMFHLLWDLALSVYVHGNYVAWKRRLNGRGGPPGELWTLDWRLLIPIMDGHRVVAWRWLGDGVPGLQRGDIILVEDTLHVAFNSPGGGELGISPLEQLGVTIRSEDALQRYSEASMRNGTRFGAAVVLDKSVKADQVIRDGVRDELIDAHGGVDQAFRPAILGGGVTDIKPLDRQTAVEAELISQRKVNREEIAAVIGIPGAVAGILDEAKYSSLKELHRLFYVTSLGGPLGLIAASLQAQLLDSEPVWDDDKHYFEFNLDEVLKGDAKERWETYGLALDHGGLTLNDVRRKENLKPYDDPRADEPLIAANNVRPLSAVGVAGTNVIDGNPAKNLAAGVRGLVARHAGAELLRIAQSLEAGAPVVLEVDELVDNLAGDLKRAGLNGSSRGLAQTIADALDRDVRAAGPDDITDLLAKYGATA